MTNTWEDRANALEELAKKRQSEREASAGHRTRMATPPATTETPGLLTFDEAMKTLPGWTVKAMRATRNSWTPIFDALAARLGNPLGGI